MMSTEKVEIATVQAAGYRQSRYLHSWLSIANIWEMVDWKMFLGAFGGTAVKTNWDAHILLHRASIRVPTVLLIPTPC